MNEAIAHTSSDYSAPESSNSEPAPQATAAAAEMPRRRSTVREPAPSSANPGNGEMAAPIAISEITPPLPDASSSPASSEAAEKPRRTGWWGKRLLGDKS
jgi:ribonuclease E